MVAHQSDGREESATMTSINAFERTMDRPGRIGCAKGMERARRAEAARPAAQLNRKASSIYPAPCEISGPTELTLRQRLSVARLNITDKGTYKGTEVRPFSL